MPRGDVRWFWIEAGLDIAVGQEIERKFLVVDEGWRTTAGAGTRIEQAYLASSNFVSVRIRVENRVKATLTIKSRTPGLRRDEFEYEIPHADAQALLVLRTGASIDKVRYRVPNGPLTWEIDVFEAENSGLVIAEIELQDEQQLFGRPSWLGQEITQDERYYNASLASRPFSRWTSRL
jgi:adenylate cyclase